MDFVASKSFTEPNLPKIECQRNGYLSGLDDEDSENKVCAHNKFCAVSRI